MKSIDLMVFFEENSEHLYLNNSVRGINGSIGNLHHIRICRLPSLRHLAEQKILVSKALQRDISDVLSLPRLKASFDSQIILFIFRASWL